MNHTMRFPLLASLVLVSLSLSAPAQAQQTSMTFFITSTGPGKEADLGGLEGADRYCQWRRMRNWNGCLSPIRSAFRPS